MCWGWPRPGPNGGRFRCSRARRLQQGLGLGGQAGDETAGTGCDPVAAAAFAPDPDQAGQVAPVAVGIDMGKIGGIARRPAAADLNPAVVLPDRVRVYAGIHRGSGFLRPDREVGKAVDAALVGLVGTAMSPRIQLLRRCRADGSESCTRRWQPCPPRNGPHGKAGCASVGGGRCRCRFHPLRSGLCCRRYPEPYFFSNLPYRIGIMPDRYGPVLCRH